MEIFWIITNCNSNAEAMKIGNILLKKREIACFDVLSRVKTAYFWPPKSSKIEKGKGAMLVCVSLPKNFKKVFSIVHELHSDKVPFVGSLKLGNVSKEYFKWLKGELA